MGTDGVSRIETKDETSAGHELEGRPAEGVTPQKEIKTWYGPSCSRML